MSTFQPVAKLGELLKHARTKLEPGISVSLLLSNDNVYLQYSVRVMKRGKRFTLGTFFTHSGAADALWGFKRDGSVVISDTEQQAREYVRTGGLVKSVAVLDIQDEDKKLTNEEMLELQEFFAEAGVMPYELTGEVAIEKMDSTGVLRRITPAMQIAYNSWSVKAASESLVDSSVDSMQDMGQGDVSPVDSVTANYPVESGQADNPANSGAQQSGETDADYDARMAALFGLD